MGSQVYKILKDEFKRPGTRDVETISQFRPSIRSKLTKAYITEMPNAAKVEMFNNFLTELKLADTRNHKTLVDDLKLDLHHYVEIQAERDIELVKLGKAPADNEFSES